MRATTSQPRNLLSMARLNSARSRVRCSICSLVRIAQTCFCRNGGLAPVSFPLFQGTRLVPVARNWHGSPWSSSSVTEENELALTPGAEILSAFGQQRTKADFGPKLLVRFSNRPFGVKHFQTIHHCSVDVAHGLVLLFGIGTKALPSWDSRTRRNNLLGGLAVRRTAGPSGHTNSPHPSSREGHHSTARWSSSFLLSYLILHGSHAAAASRVQRNSVPSTHMRCMITASRRASATIAFFIPRRLAICIAQALSQDHFFERIMA